MNWALVGSVFVTLVVIMDPPGAIPIFLALTRGQTPDQMHKAALQASLTSLGLIIAFAVFGQQVLNYLHISNPALQGAGGLLLLLVSLQLLISNESYTADEEATGNVALVPLGTPLLAGPGAIVATILFVQQADGAVDLVAIALGIVLVHMVIFAALRFSPWIARVLGDGGINILTKVAGLLLAAIAVQLIAESVQGFIAEGIVSVG